MGLLTALFGNGNNNSNTEKDAVQKTAEDVGEALITGDAMREHDEKSENNDTITLGATGRLMALCAEGKAERITDMSFDNEPTYTRGGMSMA